MSIGKQPNHKTFDQIALSDHNFADFSQQWSDEAAGFPNGLVYLCQPGIHLASFVNVSWTLRREKPFSFRLGPPGLELARNLLTGRCEEV
jgi:hypothetical protein